jgi:hypothetical protein
MPQLLEIGPERMLERAKADGLLVPMQHYRIYVCGASTAGLRPQDWMKVKRFWEMYFAAAGATSLLIRRKETFNDQSIEGQSRCEFRNRHRMKRQ